MTEFARIAVASRAFSLAAIVGLAITFGNPSALSVTAAVIAIAGVTSYVGHVSAVPSHWLIAGEASLVSLVVVSTLPDSVVLLPYLVVLPLLTGLARGVAGASVVILCQLTAMLLMALTSGGLQGLGARVELLSPWALTIVGAGLIGAWTKKMGRSPAGTALDETYDSARRLLGQLRTLARRLPTGLDPVTISSQMIAHLHERTGCHRSGVVTKTEGGLFAPLTYSGADAREALDPGDPRIAACWARGEAVTGTMDAPGGIQVHVVVLPLRLGTEMVGAIIGHIDAEISHASITPLQRELDEMSVRLATALAFSEVRSLVTADERQRLAREIHDGVAQEVASLGYTVDELAAMSSDPEVTHGLKELRSELSRVITELRLSIFDLRSEVGAGPGLGSALSDYVRKVGSRSSMRVHLTLDEAPSRLSPGVEAELFRIAQEAITNARKHSHAENLWVDCWVRPPSAEIRVRDDGCGLRTGRSDSYGLRIMHERADRIDANVRIEHDRQAPGRTGTCVTISVGKNLSTRTEGVSAAS